MSDAELLASIRSAYSAPIRAAVAGTIYPEAFVAALTANESAGNPEATRFEQHDFADLALVMIGRTIEHNRSTFGAITRDMLLHWVDPNPDSPRKTVEAIGSLVNLATSWGLTQIMGYEALAGGYALSELTAPPTHYLRTVQNLENFRKRWEALSASGLFNVGVAEAFFRCWNTGRPDGKTFDPAYVPNGIRRMAQYMELPLA